jgi:hypothetical protein
MITFTKAQLASLLATGVDFLVTFLLLRWAGLPSTAASGRVTFYGVDRDALRRLTSFYDQS